jgi:hypothetical protein
MPFNDLVRRAARGGGRPALLVHFPLALARPLVSLLSLLPEPPITPAELAMLVEGSACDPEPAARAFGVRLRPIDAILNGTEDVA